MAGFNLRKTLGRSCHVRDQLSELGVRQAATHAVEASRYRGQKLLVAIVLPVMQKGLTCVARRFTSPSKFVLHSRHLSVHPTRDACHRGSRASASTRRMRGEMGSKT